MDIIRENDIRKLDRFAVDKVLEASKKAVSKKDSFVIGIPGGSSVKGIFELFSTDERIPWKRTHIFMVDERLVGPSDERSNFRLAKELFLKRLLDCNRIAQSNIHPFMYSKGLVKESLSNYNNQIEGFGSKYDLVLLSAGEDCHVASLFPGHSSIKDDSDRYIYIGDAPKKPSRRISASRSMLLRSGSLILLFYGESKRKAFEGFTDKKIDMTGCPSKIAYRIKDSYVLTDIY